MQARFTHEARREFNDVLPPTEKAAMQQVVTLLEEFGDQLGEPHTSRVRGTSNLRELRPRGGRSAWRGFYRRIGAEWVIGAFGPEADADPTGFRRAVRLAEQRLDAAEQRP